VFLIYHSAIASAANSSASSDLVSSRSTSSDCSDLLFAGANDRDCANYQQHFDDLPPIPAVR
ncbi:hypothetical protein WG66_014902, partial [Moniliophthora roreri]